MLLPQLRLRTLFLVSGETLLALGALHPIQQRDKKGIRRIPPWWRLRTVFSSEEAPHVSSIYPTQTLLLSTHPTRATRSIDPWG